MVDCMLADRAFSALVSNLTESKGERHLAHSKSAKKRIRVNERRRQRNRVFRSASRTRVRRAERLIEQGNAEAAALAVGEAISTLDRAAIKGIIHKNNAARRKSRLMKKFNGLVRPAEQPQA